MSSDTYSVVRTGSIAAPIGDVYGHVVDFHKWEAWSPWKDIDPEMTQTYTGPGAGVGSLYEWSGNRKAGQGSMLITEAVADDHVTLDLKFLKPFKSEAAITIALTDASGGTDVVWTMTGEKTLMSKVMGIFVSMDKMVGPDFERGIAQLRAVAEAGV